MVLNEITYNMKNNTLKGIYFIDDLNQDRFVPYSKLFTQIMKMSEFLKKKKIRQNVKVIFQIRSNETFLCALWACIHIGAIAIPIEVSSKTENINRLFNICNELHDELYIIKDFDIPVFLKHMDDLGMVVDIRNYEDELAYVNESTHTLPDNNTVAYIQYTSGSSGHPKGIVLTHENIISNIQAVIIGAEVTQRDSSLSWLPLTHNMGLIGFHMIPAFLGANHVIMSPHLFIKHPSIWLEKIEFYKVTMTGIPDFALGYCLRELKKIPRDFDLHTLRLILDGSEPIDYVKAMKFLEVMKKNKLPDNSLLPVYGLTEGTVAVAFPKISESIKTVCIDKKSLNSTTLRIRIRNDGYPIVTVGNAVNNVDIKILNINMVEAQEGEVGSIWIKGKSVAKTYIADDKMTELTDKSGWYNTKDLGFFWENHLYILGRENELVFHGKNYFMRDAEEVLANVLIGEDDLPIHYVLMPAYYDNHRRIILFIESEYKDNLVKKIKDSIRKVIELTDIKIDGIVFVDSFPRTVSNKIKRIELVNNYQADKYYQAILLGENEEEINSGSSSLSTTETILINCFQDVYKRKVDINQDIREITHDSLNFYIFIAAVEEQLQKDRNPNDFWQCKTLKDVAECFDKM